MSRLSEYLNRHIVGNVFDRPSICNAYSTDSSILTYTPKLVAIPETQDDVRRLLRFANQLAARELRLPITMRGSGLDKTGASIGPGMIVSTEKLNQIEEVDARGRLIRLQPGVKLGELNQALRLNGLWLPIGYDKRATIGGLISDNPTDDYSYKYGGIFHYVERVEITLPSGDLVQLAAIPQRAADSKAKEDSAEGVLYRKVNQLLDEQADTILDRSMRPFDAEGYANIVRVREKHMMNLLPLLFASQGTLGAITDIILRLEPLPSTSRRMMVSFHDLKTAQRFMNYARDLKPYLLKLVDLAIIERAIENGKKLDFVTRKLGKGVLVIAGFDFSKHKTKRCLEQLSELLPNNAQQLIETAENYEDFEEIESFLTNYLNDGDGERTAILDNVFVPSMNFTDFVQGLKTLEQTVRKDLPIYGSFAAPNYNLRPDFDLSDFGGRQEAVDFMQMYSELVVSCQGSITANYPEGRTRSIVQIATLSANERQLYAGIKSAFDPLSIMNPGVKLGASAEDAVRHLRTTEKGGIVTP